MNTESEQAYNRAIQEDIAHLQVLFQKAWPRIPEARPDELYSLATWCQTLRALKLTNRLNTKKVTTPLASAAKRLLKELNCKIQELETEEREQPGILKLTGQDQFLDHVRKSDNNIRAFLAFEEVRSSDPASVLLAPTQTIWQRRNQNPPKPSKDNDPVCQFITGILTRCNINLAPETVNDMLRGRYQRKRSGKNNSKG